MNIARRFLCNRTTSMCEGHILRSFRTSLTLQYMNMNKSAYRPYTTFITRLGPYTHRTRGLFGLRGGFMQRVAQSTKTGLNDIPQKANSRIPSNSEFKKLLNLARPEKWRLTGAIGLLVISSSVTMSVPFCMGKIIDILYNSSSETTNTLQQLNYISSILVVVFIIGAVANFGRIYLMQSSGQRIVRSLRDRIFSSIIKQEVAFFDKTRTGELINRLSTDTTVVGQSVTMNISDGLRSSVQAIGCVSMMLYMSPKLSMMALGIVPTLAGMSIVYGRYLKKITKNVQDSLAKSTEVAEERISNIRTVRAFAQETKELDRYRERIDHVLKLSYQETLARAVFFGLTGLSGNAMVLSVFYFGGRLMQDSQITIGELSSFMLYAAFIGVSIGGLSSFYTELMRGLGASTRLWQIAEKEPLIPITDGISPDESIKGKINFNDVTFSYPSRMESPIFSGLNLSVPAGSVMAIVGPSGSGKSTITSLLLRFYDPDKGSVRVDDMDIKTLNPSWLRHHVGTVSQEPILFSSTIAENIAYGANNPETVSHQEIIEAAKKANAHNFVDSFPQKYDTVVGERGIMLSGGQRQRIAIARAILKNPKILLLDEATSALDAESEYLVQEALDHLMTDRTVISIAHRLSTIRSADCIAVIDNGKIVEQGTYGDLMQYKEGLFRKLVERQTIQS